MSGKVLWQMDKLVSMLLTVDRPTAFIFYILIHDTLNGAFNDSVTSNPVKNIHISLSRSIYNGDFVCIDIKNDNVILNTQL